MDIEKKAKVMDIYPIFTPFILIVKIRVWMMVATSRVINVIHQHDFSLKRLTIEGPFWKNKRH